MSIPPSNGPATSLGIITAKNITDGATYELNFHDVIPDIVKDTVGIEVNDYFVRMKGTASFDKYQRWFLEKTVRKEVYDYFSRSNDSLMERNASYMVIDPPATSSGGDDSAIHATVADNDKPLSDVEIFRHVQYWAEVEVEEYFVRIVKAEVKDFISKFNSRNKFSGKSEDSSSCFEGRDASETKIEKDDKNMSHQELLKIAEDMVRIEVKGCFEKNMMSSAGQDIRMFLKEAVKILVKDCLSRSLNDCLSTSDKDLVIEGNTSSMSVIHKDPLIVFQGFIPIPQLPNIKSFVELEVNCCFLNMVEFDLDLQMLVKEIVKAEVNDCFSRLLNYSTMTNNDNFPMEEDFSEISDQEMASRSLSLDVIDRRVKRWVRKEVTDYCEKMRKTATFGQNFRMLLNEMVKAEVKIRNNFPGKSEDTPLVGDIPASSAGRDVSALTGVSREELKRKVRMEVNGYFTQVKETATFGTAFRTVLKEIAETEVKDFRSKLQKASGSNKRKRDTPMGEIVDTEADVQNMQNTNIPISSSQVLEEVQYDNDFENYPIGIRFQPKSCELINDYLKPKIKYGSVPNDLITELNLMDVGPNDISVLLPPIQKSDPHNETRYFFTKRARKYGNGSRPNRKSGEGYWRASTDKEIHDEDNGAIIGHMRTLNYYEGKQPNGKKTNWIMHEYRVDDTDEKPAVKKRALDDNEKENMDLDFVLCRIYCKTKSSDQQ